MAALKTNIELLPQEEWEKTSFGKILNWSLTVGRWIVIVTELVVIIAFLSRFKLDRDLTDLNEKIKQQQSIITASSAFEKEFRLLQQRVKTIENIRSSQLASDMVLNELATLTPVDVTFSNIRVDKNQVSLKASASSEAGLATLVNNLKKSSRFGKVTITKLGLAQEGEIGLSFEIKTIWL